MKSGGKLQRQEQQQIPCGDDNKKGKYDNQKGKCNNKRGKCNNKYRDSSPSASLRVRMTA